MTIHADQLTHHERVELRIARLRDYATATCDKCDQVIFWAFTPKGKKIALDFGPVEDGKRYKLQIGGSVDAPPRSLTAWFTTSKPGYLCHFDRCNSEAGSTTREVETSPSQSTKDSPASGYSPVSRVRTDGKGHFIGIETCICPPFREGTNTACPVCFGGSAA